MRYFQHPRTLVAAATAAALPLLVAADCTGFEIAGGWEDGLYISNRAANANPLLNPIVVSKVVNCTAANGATGDCFEEIERRPMVLRYNTAWVYSSTHNETFFNHTALYDLVKAKVPLDFTKTANFEDPIFHNYTVPRNEYIDFGYTASLVVAPISHCWPGVVTGCTGSDAMFDNLRVTICGGSYRAGSDATVPASLRDYQGAYFIRPTDMTNEEIANQPDLAYPDPDDFDWSQAGGGAAAGARGFVARHRRATGQQLDVAGMLPLGFSVVDKVTGQAAHGS
ncbi:hypothetical protein Micbo1qcDRAFT_179188 [Microdochium bolleyi]|uniref:Uncharacterized protein n=1 Tax=Microdochium bolleyi TaxID=196109 RepID=A0A136IQW7_9PEZI|nr:hypothetical protein Micbo1qcDRAFT_179188 [Microdochium bolleyi]